MIRHILFWKYTDTVKAEHKEAEALAFLQKSVATMVGHIDGLRCAEINANTAGGEYDLERMAGVLLDEYRGGKLGRITLETPDEYAEEQANG